MVDTYMVNILIIIKIYMYTYTIALWDNVGVNLSVFSNLDFI